MLFSEILIVEYQILLKLKKTQNNYTLSVFRVPLKESCIILAKGKCNCIDITYIYVSIL